MMSRHRHSTPHSLSRPLVHPTPSYSSLNDYCTGNAPECSSVIIRRMVYALGIYKCNPTCAILNMQALSLQLHLALCIVLPIHLKAAHINTLTQYPVPIGLYLSRTVAPARIPVMGGPRGQVHKMTIGPSHPTPCHILVSLQCLHVPVGIIPIALSEAADLILQQLVVLLALLRQRPMRCGLACCCYT